MNGSSGPAEVTTADRLGMGLSFKVPVPIWHHLELPRQTCPASPPPVLSPPRVPNQCRKSNAVSLCTVECYPLKGLPKTKNCPRRNVFTLPAALAAAAYVPAQSIHLGLLSNPATAVFILLVAVIVSARSPLQEDRPSNPHDDAPIQQHVLADATWHKDRGTHEQDNRM